MRRREFNTLLGGLATALGAWPLPLSAQQGGKVWRIGLLETISPELNATNFDALRTGLRSAGYVEGQNLIIEYRSADGHAERFAELASELVLAKVDVIVTRGTPAVVAARNATTTIPVVMAASGEPLASGVVTGLARPGGNVTGLSAFTNELIAKRIELLNGAVSRLTRIAFLQNMSNPVAPSQWEELQTAVRILHIEPVLLDVRNSEELARAFERVAAQKIGALVVGNDAITHANRGTIVALAAQHRLPAIYATREFVDDGGLMAYAVSYSDLYRRAATYVDKIFKGAKPADLPVEQPTRFELVINMKAAKAIGLTIPRSILAAADEVIE
jgi:putative tryptophan/tyrosine transport system substrate-binding protein